MPPPEGKREPRGGITLSVARWKEEFERLRLVLLYWTDVSPSGFNDFEIERPFFPNAMSEPPQDAYALIARTLHVGGVLSFALLLAGLLWTVTLALIHGATPPRAVRDPATGALHGNVLLLHAGLIALIATPVLRILAALWSFARSRDSRYARIAALVFLTILVSVFLPYFLSRVPGR